MRDRAAVAIAAMALVIIADAGAVSGDPAIPLLLPQGAAFSILGHSCGGIQEQALVTGFDPTTGLPGGNVYLQTRCGGSGRGGGYHTTTYSAWAGVTWDFTGTVASFSRLGAAPPGIDPAFSAVDAFGNEVYNQLNAVNVLPSNCAVGNTTYCSYRAYLLLASDFVPAPAVTGVSVNSGSTAGGTIVTITGAGFSGATDVAFGAVPAASFSVDAATTITAVSPAETAGTVDVTVTTTGGTSLANPGDQFTFLANPTLCGDGDTCMDYDGHCKLCGSPVSESSTTVSDALFILRAAIGEAACSPCVCDVDGSGSVGAADALRTLRLAVGENVTFDCPTP